MYYLLNDNKYLYQIVESLLFCLLFNKKECELVNKINYNDNNIYIIFSINKLDKLPKNFIVYNFEQLGTERLWSDDFFKKCRKALKVLDYSLINIEVFKRNNISAYHLPYGWCPMIEPEYNICPKDKELDIIFLGSKNERRSEFLSNFDDIYINDKCFYNDYEDITKKAKFSFNIHFYKKNTILELTRIIPLISRGVIVLSERSTDSYYDNIFDDICIFINLNEIDRIKEIISNYDFRKCVENKKKLVDKLNYVKIISENINLF
jgi:hypothetical protein